MVASIARLLIITVGFALALVVSVVVVASVLGSRAPSLPRAEVIEEWSCEVTPPASVATRSFAFPVDSSGSARCQLTTDVAVALRAPTAFLCLVDPGRGVSSVEARVWVRPVALGRSERCRFTTTDGERIDVWEMSPSVHPNLRPH